MKNKVTVEAKLDEEIVKKLYYIAAAEGRTVNNHMLHLIRTNISYFERVHGKISPKDIESIKIDNQTEN